MEAVTARNTHLPSSQFLFFCRFFLFLDLLRRYIKEIHWKAFFIRTQHFSHVDALLTMRPLNVDALLTMLQFL